MSPRPGAPVRVAVLGLGWAGREIWLPRLLAHPAFDVVAVVDPRHAGERSPAAPAQAVLADPAALSPDSVDLAIVAVPNHLHADVACGLLERGIAVFVEKPVCLSSQEADRLAVAEQAGGAVLLAGSAAACRSDVLALCEQAASLGRIRHIDLAWIRAGGVPDAGGWFTRRSQSGGGALVDLGWHLLGAVAPLLGPAEFENVVAVVSDDFVNSPSRRAAWRRDAPGGDGLCDVEDTARGFLVTGDGVSVSLRASWASHESVDVTRIGVEGSTGSAVLECTFGFSPNRIEVPELRVVREGETTWPALRVEPPGAEYDRQLDRLPGLLADPAGRGRAAADVRRTVDVVERMYDSSRSARTGSLPVPGSRRHAARTGSASYVRTAVPPGGGRLEAVVFDLDGVLVDSFQVMRKAFTVAHAEVVGPGPVPFEEYNKHLGRYFPDIMRIMGLPLEMEEPFVRESYRLAHEVPVFPGVVEMLRGLRERGTGLAVATGKSGPRARSLLEVLGLLPYFSHVIGSDEVARPKPAPDIVLRALDLLGAAPQASVMIGDAVTDLASARGAGVSAIAAIWGETDEAALLAEEPDAVLAAPRDLLELMAAASAV